MTSYRFTTYGTAAPQGSTKAFVNKRTGKAQITADNKKTKPWRAEIGSAAQDAYPQDAGPWQIWFPTEPVAVFITVTLPRPPSVSARKRPFPTVTPDLDKLVRACLDALTDLAWHDDAQVITINAEKHYAAPGTAAQTDIEVRAI